MSGNRNNQTTGNPSYEIWIDGEELPFSIRPVSVLVVKKLNKISFAKLIFPDGDPAEGNFNLSSSAHFTPGNQIEIKAGYSQDNLTIFKGKVTRHSIKANQGQMSMLTVECRDAAYELSLQTKSKYFYDMSDSEVFEEIISAYQGLGKDIESTSLIHKVMVQFNSTDWDFLLKRTKVNSLVLFTDDGILKAFKPGFSTESTQTYTYGANVLEFEGEIDSRNSIHSAKVVAWDASVQELAEAEGNDPGEPGTGNWSAGTLANASPNGNEAHRSLSQQLHTTEIQQIADAILMKSRLSKTQGRAKLQGDTSLKPGILIELQGLGDRFNGKTFVSAVRHELANGNFISDVELGLKDEWFSLAEKQDIPPLLPLIKGLHVGVVKQLEDPEGEDRVRVMLPVVSPADEGYWARIATLDAGDNRGSFFRPEIGDEVIVGFLEDDPRHPVILGMLNSSAKPAPSPGSDDNHEKGFVTRSGMKFWFNDDEPSVLLETPAGNMVKLSDSDQHISMKDQHGNSVLLESGGIQLESPADISIKASGDVKIEGVSVDIKAQAGFKADGSASAEVSSSGTAVLKGSLVQIN